MGDARDASRLATPNSARRGGLAHRLDDHVARGSPNSCVRSVGGARGTAVAVAPLSRGIESARAVGAVQRLYRALVCALCRVLDGRLTARPAAAPMADAARR